MDNSKYEAVLIKVQMACPELEQYETVPCPDGMVGCCVHHQRKVYTPARLSHVLRAIEVIKPCCDCMNGGSKYCNSGWHCNDVSHIWSMLLAKYDLTKEDLSLQSPETIDFLFKILCE